MQLGMSPTAAFWEAWIYHSPLGFPWHAAEAWTGLSYQGSSIGWYLSNWQRVFKAGQAVAELLSLIMAVRSLLSFVQKPHCFPRNTLVATEEGLRPISRIEAGERVWAYDFEGAEWRLCAVECRHDRDYDGLLVTIDLGLSQVTATAYHPFWVMQGSELENRPALSDIGADEDRGKSLPGRWVNSHDLREGDVVFLREHGPARIRRVIRRYERTPVSNLTVKELHTFAVGESQVVVHNTSGTGPLDWPEKGGGIPSQTGAPLTALQRWTARLEWLEARRRELRKMLNGLESGGGPAGIMQNLRDQIKELTIEIAEANAHLHGL
jgi:hypothetical protein